MFFFETQCIYTSKRFMNQHQTTARPIPVTVRGILTIPPWDTELQYELNFSTRDPEFQRPGHAPAPTPTNTSNHNIAGDATGTRALDSGVDSLKRLRLTPNIIRLTRRRVAFSGYNYITVYINTVQ